MLFSLLAPLMAASAFAFVTDANGVNVSMRTDTKDIEVVADGRFDAPPEKVLAVMLAYDKAKSWQKELGESRVLDREANALDVYQRLKLPIISDRDYILHVTWGNDDKGVWMHFATTPTGPPSPKGVVRMPVHEGTWRLDRGADGHSTNAHYEVRMDLGGSLPAGMARKNVAKSIPNFFEGLRGALKHGSQEGQ
jgi:hypothetical protein